jgi:cysteine desulfurase
MDHSATSPVDEEVVRAMLPYFTDYFGNASSMHSFGGEACSAMDGARAKVASLIRATSEEVIFTAGGTESDNIAIKGVAFKKKECLAKKGPHIITSAIEHPAVLETCRHLEKIGYSVKYLPVDKYGLVSPEALENAISEGTVLITIMHANNEIGTIEPAEEIGKIAKRNDIIFHTDAVQSAGKIPIDVKKMNIDMLSISAHKMYGPKGIGALYIKKGVAVEPIIHGGGHERGIRSSTENIPGIVGLGKAAELAEKRMEKDTRHLLKLRDGLIRKVLKIEQSYLNGHPKKRLPNNAHFRFSGIEGESLVLLLDKEGIAASTGSACSSHKLEASHVLMAIGLNEVDAHGSLRLTLGRGNAESDIKYVVDAVEVAVKKLRGISPLWKKEMEIEKWKKQLEKGEHVH